MSDYSYIFLRCSKVNNVFLRRAPLHVSGSWKLRVIESPGLDWPGHSAQKAQTLLQVSDSRTRERVSVQRLRVQTEEVGTRKELEPNREASQDMVPKQTNEKQKEFAAASGASGAKQQQQFERQQPQPPRRPPPCASPRGAAPRRARQAPSVTRALLWDLPSSPRYSKLNPQEEVPKDSSVFATDGRT